MIQNKLILEQNNKQIGTLKISDMCYLTYPCSHIVENLLTGEIKRMSGREIYIILKEQNISDKHFEKYNDIQFNKSLSIWNSNFKSLTEEEIQRNIEAKEKRELDKKKAYEHRASSRLERLKKKHNISP